MQVPRLSLPCWDTNKSKDIFIVVPYSKGLSKSFKNICGKVRVQVNIKGNNTVKDILVAPKDRDSIVNKGGGCTMEYIGELVGILGTGTGTSMAPLPSLTIPKLQVILSSWITSP